MATASVTLVEAGRETGPVYRLRENVEIFPLDSSSSQPRYVVRTGDEKSFVVSQELREILELFDGRRTLDEVARILSSRQRKPVSLQQMSEVVARFIRPHQLIEHVDLDDCSNDPATRDEPQPASRKRSFEFVFRLPIISHKAAVRITRRLTWMFEPRIVIALIAGVIFAQIAFLANWFAGSPNPTFTPRDILIDYLLVVTTALIHEFGHATACQKYRCEHGSIGFLLYMIFPSFYINLSNAWRLPGRQRAVIDIGGIYFQLLTTIPLYLVYLTTGDTHCAVAILSVDSMVLLSLNPILKFDGYWLLVDLSGLVNLRARGWRVVREVVAWSLGIRKDVPLLNEVAGTGKKLLLVFYSFLTLALFTSFIIFIIAFAPARAGALTLTIREMITGQSHGGRALLENVGKLLTSLIFFLFAYRLLQAAVFRPLSKRRKSYDGAK